MEHICLVIDLEGFHIKSKGGFHVREMGFCDWTSQSVGSKSYQTFGAFKDLSFQDRKTAAFVIDKIHGLPYKAKPQENARPPQELDTDIRSLYEQHKTPQRHIIAYKGGHVERDLLTRLNIPSYNLEESGCPPFRCMKRLTGVLGCGHHNNPSLHHCPMVECFHFVDWMKKTVVK